MRSLKASGNELASPEEQLRILAGEPRLEPFAAKYSAHAGAPLRSKEVEIFQVNVGRLCNQICKHCHVDAGPDRREIMTRETMELCLRALEGSKIQTVDLTGGAPEMNPDFKFFVKEIRRLGRHVIVRSNLTILVTRGYEDMPEFLAEHQAEVVSSLPFYSAANTDRQRGEGVFEKSVRAIRRLNELGYARDGSGLVFNLVYNPTGAFLPASQASLEKDYRQKLWESHQLRFNHLFTITNIPIGRFLDYLLRSGNYETYLERLASQYNPAAAGNVMCRNTISVSWDGRLFDCDFNQMLELETAPPAPRHVREFDSAKLASRPIVTRQHCYACTAGAGSSCGGATT